MKKYPLFSRSRFLLTATLLLSGVGMLVACDNSEDSANASSGWTAWLQSRIERQNEAPPQTLMVAGGVEQRTVAGSYLATQFAEYRQDWKKAHEYLDRLIQLDPDNMELQQRAMVLAMQAGDSPRAIAMARRVLEKDDENLIARMFLGVDSMARQEFSDAIRMFSRMPDNPLTDFARMILIAWAQAAENKFDEEALVAQSPLHAYHALLIADYLGEVKNPEQYFIHVVAGGGGDRHMMENMADVFTRQGQKELANKIYESLLKQDNSASVSSHDRELAKKIEQKGPVTSARIETPMAGGAEVFYNLSRVMLSEGITETALIFLRLSQILAPANDDVRMMIAGLMAQSGHEEEAIALFKSVKPGQAGYVESMRSIADLYEKENRIPEAIAFLEERFAEEGNIDYLIQIGDIHRRGNKHTEAIKAYDRAASALGGTIGREYWHLLYARGMSHERADNFRKAEKDLLAALELRPDYPYLLNYLGYSWAEQGIKLDKAKEMIEKAVSLKPDDGYIVDSLGWVYYQIGEYEKAVAELERAVELVPYDPTINDHLGDAYWQVGRRQEARFQWQRALNHADEQTSREDLLAKIDSGLPPGKTATVKEAKTGVTQIPPPAPPAEQMTQ